MGFACCSDLRIGRLIYDQCRQCCDGQKLPLILLVVKDKASSAPAVSQPGCSGLDGPAV